MSYHRRLLLSAAREIARRHIWALALVCTMSACTTSKSIETAIEIRSPPCRVFAVLAEFARYPEWNPYHIRVTGIPEAGASLDIRVLRPDGKVVDVPHVRMLEVEPCRALVWGGGVSGLFRGEHRFDLSPGPAGVTLLSQSEHFSGLFTGLADLPVDVLTEGYEAMNAALKSHMVATAADRESSHP